MSTAQIDDVTAAARTISLIGVGVSGYPEGRDAAALASLIARVTRAEMLLIAIHADPLVVLPNGMKWEDLEKQAQQTLTETRDALAPGARVVVTTDLSVPRALERVVRTEHRDLLVVGSSRHAPPGVARIGKRTRQLLSHFTCPLAVAPRGYEARVPARVGRIGVGFDGGPEATAAAWTAAALANAAGAELTITAVVDDRMPASGFSYVWTGDMIADWERQLEAEATALGEQAKAMADGAGGGRVEVVTGRPADALLALSSRVDLLVIGSRRWGPVARVLLGSSGEAVLHDATSPVIVVPRPE